MDCVIGLGSNLGDRRAFLERAALLVARAMRLLAVSALYETAPIGPPQPSFLNAALRISTALSPLELLGCLLQIELELGRRRTERWGPRSIDLDILWSPGLLISSEGLILPHPELARRAFALAPLLEVAPEARDPKTGESYQNTLLRIGQAGVALVRGSESGCWLQKR
jgi:2-amino-4-hydroxy-6-hydroxymethyldihydropteridine diphosphokinase